MSNKLFYWEHAVISQPEEGQSVLVVFKSGNLEPFTYKEINKEWFIRNIAQWQKETTFTYEQLSKAQDFISDCYHNYDCQKDAHKYNNGSCISCNAKEILGL